MVIIYCPVCRRIKISRTAAEEMENFFEETEREEVDQMQEDLLVASEEERMSIEISYELQSRVCISVPENLEEETWTELTDQEWGVICTIINSPNLLYLVDNYADYLEKCPDCQTSDNLRDYASNN